MSGAREFTAERAPPLTLNCPPLIGAPSARLGSVCNMSFEYPMGAPAARTLRPLEFAYFTTVARFAVLHPGRFANVRAESQNASPVYPAATASSMSASLCAGSVVLVGER